MTNYVLIPGLSLRSNPGLKLANAFGVILIKFQTGTLLTRLADFSTKTFKQE